MKPYYCLVTAARKARCGNVISGALLRSPAPVTVTARTRLIKVSIPIPRPITQFLQQPLCRCSCCCLMLASSKAGKRSSGQRRCRCVSPHAIIIHGRCGLQLSSMIFCGTDKTDRGHCTSCEYPPETASISGPTGLTASR